MKIALVHDDFMQWGGAERVFATWAEIFPDAPVFTIATTPPVLKKAGLSEDRMHTTWINSIPFKTQLNKALFLQYPMLFESFDFSEFDVVLSSSARFAHSVVTKPTTKHISYVHSPFRGFWDPKSYFGDSARGRLLRTLLGPVLLRMRGWDYIAGQRADFIVSNSHTIQKRVKKYWRRDSDVIYPFVDLDRFKKEGTPSLSLPNEYYVVVTRLALWKRIDLVVEACMKLQKPVIIIGTGTHLSYLQSIAKPPVQVVGFLEDPDVSYIVRRAKALIHPQQEDFGMTIVEAHACGTPVIAYGVGGATETLVDGKSGIFFNEQTVDSLADAIVRFESLNFDKEWITNYAQKFSKDSFTAQWKDYVSAAFAGHAPKTMD